MKLCPVCDQEVKGSWCKNCKKFVKPYELSKNAHINTLHDESNDPECDYHGTATGNYSTTTDIPGMNSNAGNTQKDAYTQTSQPVRIPVTDPTRIPEGAKLGGPLKDLGTTPVLRSPQKPNKRFFAMFAVWAVLVVALILVTRVFSGNGKKKPGNELLVTLTPVSPSFSIADGEEAWETFCEEMGISEMRYCFPIEEQTPEDEDDYFNFYYLDIDELKECGESCRAVEHHLDVTWEEIRNIYQDSFPNFSVDLDETGQYQNYMMTHEFYVSTYFNSTAELVFGDSEAFVDYDTASDKLHRVSIFINDNRKEAAEGTVLLLEAVGDRSFTVSSMSETLSEIQKQMQEQAEADEDVLHNQKIIYKTIYEGKGVLCEMRLIYLNAEDPEGKFSLEDTIPIWTVDITGTKK